MIKARTFQLLFLFTLSVLTKGSYATVASGTTVLGDRGSGANTFVADCEHTPTTLYVDASRPSDGDGASWLTAFKDLNAALAVANACPVVREIKVAEGSYKPTKTTDQTISFSINRAGLKIIGGYPAGGGTRNHRSHISILEGLLAIDPVNLVVTVSYHILTVVGISGTDSVIVDGFRIQNGGALSANVATINGVSVSQQCGGGIYLGDNAGDPPVAVRNCIFSETRAGSKGGGIYAKNSRVTLNSNRFLNNFSSEQGAGIYIDQGSVVITNSLFTQNRSHIAGGAITFDEVTAATIINSTFYRNYITSSDPYGGAINCFQTTMTVRNSIFNGNRYDGSTGDPTRTSSDLFHNDNSTLAISNSIMQSTAPYLFCSDCLPANTDPKFTNTGDPLGNGFLLLAGSQAIDKGDNSQLLPNMLNDVHGSARVIGGLVDMGAYESPTFATPLSILYVNESLTTGNNNGSSWANAFSGANGVAHALIYARIIGNIEQIWVAKGTYYPASRPDNLTSANALDPNNAFSLVNGIKVYGGFLGNESELNQRNTKTNVTILSGDLNKDGERNNSDAYHVFVNVSVGAETLLDGFTITSGNTRTSNSTTISVQGVTVNQAAGGGMYSVQATPVIRDCIFYKNVSRSGGVLGGGGMFCLGPQPFLQDVVFRENDAFRGGGLFAFSSISEFSNVTFEDNTASEGGALYIYRSSCYLDRVILKGNAAQRGGAIFYSVDAANYTAAGVLTNCVFIANTASDKGGVCYYGAGHGPAPVFINSTFSKDVCTNSAGGNIIYYYNSSDNEDPQFYNCLINKAATGEFYGGANPDEYIARYNLTNYALPDNALINSNIMSADLGLANSAVPAGDDGVYGTIDDGLKPLPTSLAVDAGFNEFLPDEFNLDLTLANRTSGPFIDMGAYESYQACAQATAAIAINGDETSLIPLSAAPIPLLNGSGACRTMGQFTALNTELQTDNALRASVFVNPTTLSYAGHPYLRRHYELEPALDSEEHQGKVTLYFNSSDFQNYNTNRGSFNPLPISPADEAIANIRIWQWHGTSPTHMPGSYTKGGVAVTGKYITPNEGDILWNEAFRRWEITFRFSGFSGFFVTTLDPAALPVILSSFLVKPEKTELGMVTALLEWSTAEESNSQNFIIQRSVTGKTWEEIGQIDASRSSITTKKYTFTDEHPMQGNNLYRLKLVDLDGSFAYSSIRNLFIEFVDGIILYPNPVVDRLYFDAGSNQSIEKVVLRDPSGRILRESRDTFPSGISVKDLGPGTYLVELTRIDGVVERRKIMVLHQ